MGCLKSKRTGYLYSRFDEEADIRKFEQDDLLAFRKPLSSIINRCIIENDLIAANCVEEMAREEFSESFVQMIQNEYFTVSVNGKNYYDAKKIKLLLFLLSDDIIVSSPKFSYHDKAGFLFNFVKIRADEDISGPIEKENETFNTFIESLVDIACDGIVSAYLQQKKPKRSEGLGKLRLVKDKIVEHFISLLFSQKSEKLLTFDELNNKFDQEKFLFTSGLIREYGWHLIVECGLAHKLENQVIESEQIATSKEVTNA